MEKCLNNFNTLVKINGEIIKTLKCNEKCNIDAIINSIF